MGDRIDALSPEQAQQALLDFYNLLPKDMWSDAKPALAELKGLAEDIRDDTPAEDRPQVAALMTAKPEVRGAVARIVLHQLHAVEPFQPYVDRAVASAGQAKMIALPLMAGAALVVIALLPRATRNADGKWTIEFDPTANMKKLIDSVTGFVKECPKDILSGIMG